MESITDLKEFLVKVTRYIAQYNFDKAKDLCRREKILSNTGKFKDLLRLVPCLINVEKCYSELGFLATKCRVAIIKDNTLKTAYIEIISDCEKLLPQDEAYEFLLYEIRCLSEIRCELIEFYEKIHSAATYNKHLKIEEYIIILENIQDTLIQPYPARTLSNIKFLLEMETNCLRDLLYAEYYLENWDMVQCTCYISSLKSKLRAWENSLNNKETWKLNFFKTTASPELYRWILKFKIFILEKYSLYFYMIIRQQTSLSDLKTTCYKHHLEFLPRFQNSLKKSGHDTTNIMLVYDACGIKNWHGPGYRCPLKNIKSESTSNSYYIMLRHPEKLSEPVSLMPTIRRILVEHFSDILFLDKVVCRYIPEENGTYFIISIEEKVSLVAYYNCKKDDKQAEIDIPLLELASMIRSHRVFLSLNNGR